MPNAGWLAKLHEEMISTCRSKADKRLCQCTSGDNTGAELRQFG